MNKILLFFLVNFFAFFNQITSQNSVDYNSLPLNEKIKIKEDNARLENTNRIGNGNNHILSLPEQDCNSAIPVCQNVYNQQQSYSGVGNTDEIPGNSSCLGSNEKNSVWYVFTVSTSGNLAFNITPDVNLEDYDFALYEITNGGCQGIGSGSTTPVRCNFSATGGVTGLSSGGSNASEPASGPNQSTVLAVTVGQTYVLVLSNYSSSQNGYTLDFSPSSASIFDVTPPTVLSTFAACGATTIKVKFSEQVLCSSISANGSEFTITGTGGPYTVTSAVGLNCGNATNEVQLTLNTALAGGGPWTVSVGMGSDGNTLIDNCGNALSPPQTNVFNTSPAAASISGDNNICKEQTMALTASAGTSYSWSGPGTAGQNTNQTISVLQTNPGTYNYTVTVGNGSCGNSTANISVTVNDGPESHFTSPVTICAGQSVTFTNTSIIPCTQFGSGLSMCNCGGFGCGATPLSNFNLIHNWSFGDPLSGVDNFSTDVDPVHIFATPGTYNVNLNVFFIIGGGCSTNETQVVTVLPGATPPTASASPTTICPAASSTLTASGGASYTWTGPAGFNSTSNPVIVTPASTSTYTVTSPGCSGPNTATVTVTVSTVTLTPVISGSASVCPNATAVTYSVTNNPPNTYAWTVPAGATIASGQGTNSITVNFGAGGGNVDVTETASCGTGNGSLAVSTNTVTLTPVISGPASVCPNATAVTYSVTNTIGNTYNWTVPAGATVASGQGTNSITVDFGAGGGNVDVTETSSCGSGNASQAITVNSTPVTSAISGPATVCPNATAITYSVTNTIGSTYNWTVPAGATIASGQTTNSITVNFGATAGTISTTETSPCGTGTPVNIIVNTSATPVTSAITGPASVCANATAQTYSVINTAGSTYVWTVPAGATIASGQNTNSITVNFGATAGTISVTETAACGSGAPVTTVVTTTTAPSVPTITGPSSACANAPGLTYSVTLNGSNTYAWTVPAGATIVSGQGTNSIVVNLGATAGNVGVVESNTCGSSPNATLAVTLTTAPVTSAITGTNPVCSGATAITYSVTNTIGSTYAWTVPTGATIVSGQTTNSISVNFGTNSGTISVTETASCGSASPVLFPVIVNLAPATPSIVGNSTVCANTSAATYSVTNHAGSTYAWTASGGATILSGAATNSATVNFATTNATLQVSESNTCGLVIATYSVTVTNLVLGLVASASSVCPGFTSTLGASGADTYTWTPSGSLNTNTGPAVIATPTATTIYTVNGTLAGCPVSSTITVTLLSPLTLTVTSTSSVVCTATTTSITATGATSYTWSPSATLNTSAGSTVIATPTVQTTYSVVGTTPTCAGSAVITVSVTPAPIIQLTPNDVTICEGQSVNIIATGATSYVWANNATNFVSNNPANSNVTVNPTSTHLYFVTGITNGCTDFDTLTVTVLPKIIPNAGSNDTICIGESAGLSGFGGTTHLWSPAGSLSSVNTSFTTATPLISTNYIYTSSYNGACPETDTVRVVVNPLPVVFAGQDTTIDVEDAVLLSGFTNATSYFWTNSATLSCTNCVTPIATPTTTTTYAFQGTNQYGCENSDTVTVFVSQEFALYVPIAFSPNGDFTNEFWKPQGFGIKKIQIDVYDRWGQKMFEAKDLDSFWDGKYKGAAALEDVYVFKISGEAYSGNKISKVGHITLVR